TDVALVGIREPGGLVEVVTSQRAGRPEVRLRDELGGGDGRRVEAVLRGGGGRGGRRSHNAVRADLPCDRVVDCGGDLREIPVSKLYRGNVAYGTSRGCSLARSLVIGKEERLVVNDRAADCAAELVLMKWRPRQAGRI